MSRQQCELMQFSPNALHFGAFPGVRSPNFSHIHGLPSSSVTWRPGMQPERQMAQVAFLVQHCSPGWLQHLVLVQSLPESLQ